MDQVNLENSLITPKLKNSGKLQNYREYDIVTSENYSLRAKIKYLVESMASAEEENNNESTVQNLLLRAIRIKLI